MAYKRARVIGAAFEVPAHVRTLTDRFKATGKNTGNLLIGDALVRQLDIEITGYGMQPSPEAVEKENDLLLIPSANFLFSGFDLGWLADTLERCRLPVLMTGLGAQSPNFNTIPLLPKGTIRMVRIVAERSAAIGVRGHFTASVLEGLGVKNIAVTGCPSLFRKLKSAISIRRPPTDRPWRVSLNGSRNVLRHSASIERARAVERFLIELGMQQGWDYVLQNEFPEIPFAVGADDPSSQHVPGIIRDLGLGITTDSYRQYFQKHGRVFFNVQDWETWMQQQDLSFGSRFHGNMMALSQGIPAIVLAHDSRTTEMCELLAIPHAHIEDLENPDLQRLVEHADFDKFESRYSALLRNYRTFLEANRVSHRLPADDHIGVPAPMPDGKFEAAGRIVDARKNSPADPVERQSLLNTRPGRPSSFLELINKGASRMAKRSKTSSDKSVKGRQSKGSSRRPPAARTSPHPMTTPIPAGVAPQAPLAGRPAPVSSQPTAGNGTGDPVDNMKAAIGRKDWTAALALAESVPLEHPKWIGSQLLVGEVLLGLQRPIEAEGWFRKVLCRDPHSQKGLQLLCRSLVSQGRNAEASEVRSRLE